MFDSYDHGSIRRGFQVYQQVGGQVGVCLGCVAGEWGRTGVLPLQVCRQCCCGTGAVALSKLRP
jgi:hypothetical protein